MNVVYFGAEASVGTGDRQAEHKELRRVEMSNQERACQPELVRPELVAPSDAERCDMAGAPYDADAEGPPR